jgi:hypothetical protein
MRRLVAGLLLGGMLLARAVPAAAGDAASEVGWTLEAFFSNLWYVPTKAVVATVGLVTGGVVGLIDGGDERAAYAIWVPTASGTYILTPGHFAGSRPFAFWGRDYADTPSLRAHDTEATRIYDAKYRGN